jgi:hypothetical protein
MAEDNPTLMNWTFPEYNQPLRSKLWWLAFIIVSLLLLFFAILGSNFLFGLIVVMVASMIIFRHYHQPHDVEFSITKTGLVVDKRAYLWSDLEKYWLVFEPPEIKNLIIDFKSSIKPHLNIPLGAQNPLRVREVLGKYLTEDLEQESEPTTDALGRLLKL